jgi:hypothetical protein
MKGDVRPLDRGEYPIKQACGKCRNKQYNSLESALDRKLSQAEVFDFDGDFCD